MRHLTVSCPPHDPRSPSTGAPCRAEGRSSCTRNIRSSPVIPSRRRQGPSGATTCTSPATPPRCSRRGRPGRGSPGRSPRSEVHHDRARRVASPLGHLLHRPQQRVVRREVRLPARLDHEDATFLAHRRRERPYEPRAASRRRPHVTPASATVAAQLEPNSVQAVAPLRAPALADPVQYEEPPPKPDLGTGPRAEPGPPCASKPGPGSHTSPRTTPGEADTLTRMSSSGPSPAWSTVLATSSPTRRCTSSISSALRRPSAGLAFCPSYPPGGTPTRPASTAKSNDEPTRSDEERGVLNVGDVIRVAVADD